MSLTDSPELAYYEDGKPPEQEPPFWQKHWTKVLIGLLGIAMLVLLVVRIVPTGGGQTHGSGAVAGQVVDAFGRPLDGIQVYVDGAGTETTTGSDGRFTLESVPAGSQYLVVGVTPEPPQFIPVEVPVNGKAEVGQLTVGGQ
ncbi:MAG: carboxypeptidase regulatory-like domain-containing protein [Chloroflexota bacterium]|jgi:hypothetical protein